MVTVRHRQDWWSFRWRGAVLPKVGETSHL